MKKNSAKQSTKKKESIPDFHMELRVLASYLNLKRVGYACVPFAITKKILKIMGEVQLKRLSITLADAMTAVTDEMVKRDGLKT